MSSSSSTTSTTSCIERIGMSWRCCSNLLTYPTLFTFCCALLAAGETHYAKGECSTREVLDYDGVWLIRTAIALVLPISFALTMDSWSWVGQALRLNFEANERSPPHSPICCKCEAMWPSMLVGESFFFLIPAFCWGFCAPGLALGCLLAGVGFIFMGFGLSFYLRQPTTKATTKQQDYTTSPPDDAAAKSSCNNNEEIESAVMELSPAAAEATNNVDDDPESSTQIPRHRITPFGKSLGAYDIPETV